MKPISRALCATIALASFAVMVGVFVAAAGTTPALAKDIQPDIENKVKTMGTEDWVPENPTDGQIRFDPFPGGVVPPSMYWPGPHIGTVSLAGTRIRLDVEEPYGTDERDYFKVDEGEFEEQTGPVTILKLFRDPTMAPPNLFYLEVTPGPPETIVGAGTWRQP